VAMKYVKAVFLVRLSQAVEDVLRLETITRVLFARWIFGIRNIRLRLLSALIVMKGSALYVGIKLGSLEDMNAR